MPIANIIDHRKKPYRFLKINAVVEATWHDNTVYNGDKSSREYGGPDYEEKEHKSVEEIIEWANSFQAPVTLYLYDEDGGIYTRDIGLVESARG